VHLLATILRRPLLLDRHRPLSHIPPGRTEEDERLLRALHTECVLAQRLDSPCCADIAHRQHPAVPLPNGYIAQEVRVVEFQLAQIVHGHTRTTTAANAPPRAGRRRCRCCGHAFQESLFGRVEQHVAEEEELRRFEPTATQFL
jgi:hypothetical protein